MNRKTIIIGAVAVVVVAIAVVVATQWARLKTVASVAQNATMNEEQVTAKSSENEQIVQELEHDFRIPTIELTPEMQAAIADGSMSLEEAASQFLTTPDSAAVSEPAAPETDTATSPEPVAAPDTGTTTAPVAETPEPPVSVATPEPVQEPPAPVAQPEPEPVTPQPEPAPAPKAETPTPVAKSEPEPVATPEPEPTAELSGETEPQQNTEAPPQSAAKTETSTADQAKPEPEAPQQSADDKAKAEQEARVQNLFAQLYVLRASFNTQLDNLIGECIQEFLALDPASQTRAAKIRIVYARMDDVTAMEADCDAQVESIAAQLDEIDPALGAKARQYYKNEKDLKKASLIETYGK